MKRVWISALALFAASGAGLLSSSGARATSEDEKLDAAKLKDMVVNLGYEVKALNTEQGKEKWQFSVSKGGYDVPIGVEISPSTNYIWLTISFGEVKKDAKFEELLKKNGEIQPANFYITKKGFLMMGLAIDNRKVTPATMKRCVDLVAQDTADTADLWK